MDSAQTFEIKSFFAEQQEAMHIYEGDESSDHLMSGQRSTSVARVVSPAFNPMTIQAARNAAAPSSVLVQSSTERTTPPPQAHTLTVHTTLPTGASIADLGTLKQTVLSPYKYLSINQSPHLTARSMETCSKRLSEERNLDSRVMKKSKKDVGVFLVNASAVSQAPIAFSESKPSPPDAIEARSTPRIDTATLNVVWQDSAPVEGFGGIELSMNPALVSAELPTPGGQPENVTGKPLDASLRAVPPSEKRHANRPPGSPAPLQGIAAACKPERKAHIQKQLSPPQDCNRRSTLVDYSISTGLSVSPPHILPPTASSSKLGSEDVPKIAESTYKQELIKGAKQKGKKEKMLFTPLEYAQKLQAQLSESAARRGKQADKPFLKGKRIFYYGSDLNYAGSQTRNRMNIIIRHGGILVPKYEPSEITHIVTDADERVFLRAVGLKELSDIPQHIPTVRWSWVVSGFDRVPIRRLADASDKGKTPKKPNSTGQDPGKDVSETATGDVEYSMAHEFEHASFKARIDAGRTPWGEAARLKKEQAVEGTTSASNVQPQAGDSRRQGPFVLGGADDISSISDFTQELDGLPGAATILTRQGLPSSPSSSGKRYLGSGTAAQGLDARGSARSAHAILPFLRPVETRGSSADEGPNMNPSMLVDPLAEFYATARAEREAEMFHDADPGRSREPALPEKAPHLNHVRREVVKKGFLCDDPGGRQLLEGCPNQDVIDKLQELKALYAVKPSKDDEWRVVGYNKAIASLRRYPTRIRNYDEAIAICGVGSKTAQKIMEIIDTGALQRIGHERTENVLSIETFLGVYGVGRQTAIKWYNSGCTTLEDVSARKGGIKLSSVQEIGLRYYEDINTRIPRAEVAEIFNIIKTMALAIDPQLFVEVTGSYRRGKSTCGDIDVLITRPTGDGKTHRGVLRRLLAELHRQGIITEDLCLPDNFDELELLYRGLCRKDSSSLRRRIDFLTVPWTSRGAALLYYTGDDIFNRSLRLKAKKMGYGLNQRGLYAGVVCDPDNSRQKLLEGHIVASESEREILDILGGWSNLTPLKGPSIAYVLQACCGKNRTNASVSEHATAAPRSSRGQETNIRATAEAFVGTETAAQAQRPSGWEWLRMV
ncbi:hypothetical protein BC628DRAFT_1402467 [Trametes gibbosa]|nr:hypothetical protein BC628DRAFT_1402467 [Trametes gibbosa]